MRFAHGDRAAGITLVVATVVALLWANLGGSGYYHTWTASSHVLGLRFTSRDWVNQGVMTVFFVAVGLEIRREVTSGELASLRRAVVPIVAALSGMAVPAALYAVVVHGGPGSRGWGVPMATDVAFAVGALALVGGRRSPRLRVFLMTLAVADDVASIIVLICFYSARLTVGPLLFGIACLLALAAVECLRPAWVVPEVALGASAWWALARGGVEAAIVGVAIGALALPSPVAGASGRARGARVWEQRLQPVVTLVVLPVFAVANAGVVFRRSMFSASGAATVLLAVVVARVVGKPIGIAATAVLFRRAPAGLYDPGLGRRDLLGAGALASVGFTVPLLVISAAFAPGAIADSAKLGVLAGTVLGALIGGAALRTGPSRPSQRGVVATPRVV